MITDELPSIEKLKEITKNFWSKLADYSGQRAELNSCWREYVKEGKRFSEGYPPLLEMEVAYAKANGCLPDPPKREYEKTTLVILVGQSFQPLLQSVYIHHPQRLVPVVNQYYGDDPHDLLKQGNREKGKEQLKWLKKYIKYLPLEKQPAIDPIQDVADEPEVVFEQLWQKLQQDLADANTRIIVDITGAKKTIVAGAFLLAAYTNTEIFYIDANLYENGRPYGFSCHFRKVDSPLQELSLLEWEQIERLYRQYDFHGAISLLEPILEKMNFQNSSEKGPRLQAFRRFLQICDHWENGDLQEAEKVYQKLPKDLWGMVPTVVSELYTCWPDKSGEKAYLKPDLFLNPANVLIYAEDELARAKRLSGIEATSPNNEMVTLSQRHQYRAAFTRAYALHETLLKARVIALYDASKNAVEITLRNESSQDSSTLAQNDLEGYERIMSGLLHQLKVPDAISLLERTRPIKVKRESLQRTLTGPVFNQFAEMSDELRDVRNRVAHTYFPMSEDKVTKAIALAQVNLTNYKQEWIPWWYNGTKTANTILQNKRFYVPAWKMVIKAFRLNFIPQANQ